MRLSPNVFPDLSPDVVVDLNRRGCTIPQVWSHVEPANVVHGRFTDPGRMDLAVLCSVERVSSILVYRGSWSGDVAVLSPLPDRNYLQGVGGS